MMPSKIPRPHAGHWEPCPGISPPADPHPLVQAATWGLILCLLALTLACGTTRKQTLRTERDFQQAFNALYFNGRGRMEVPVRYGRVDLLTGTYAIEVDRVDRFHEGIGQALHYAKETGKKPGLALFLLHPDPTGLDKLDYVHWLCDFYGIRVWYINEELEKKGRQK